MRTNKTLQGIIYFFKQSIPVLIILFLLTGCSAQKKELTVWIGGSPEEVDFWEGVIHDFSNETGYDLKLVRQPTYSDQRRQALVISLEAKQPNPDLFLMDVVWVNQFIKSGWLLPLDKYAEADNFNTNVFFKNILDLVDRNKGKLYALPVFMDVGLLYYRKDLLQKYNYKPPETWNDLKNISIDIQKRMRKTDPLFNGYVWQGAQYEGLVCDYLEFVASNGGSLLNGDKVSIDSPQDVQALEFMRDLIHKYHISPENTFTEMKEEEVRRAFQNGGALFERNWTYAWNLHQSGDSKVKDKTGMMMLPHFENGKSVSALGGWHIAISKYSDEKKEAWEFIKYVTSYKVQKEMVTKIGWNPGRSDIYEDSLLIKKIPHLGLLQKAFQNAVPRPLVPYYSIISNIIQRNVNNCLAGKITAKEASHAMQKEINNAEDVYAQK